MKRFHKKDKRAFANLKPETKKPILPALILLADAAIGTAGYYWYWSDKSANLIDAFYMTFITITTIGFHEVFPLDSYAKIFTVGIGIIGIGSLFYILSIVMENLFIIQLHNYRGKRKKMKIIQKLSNHSVIAGYGRVGQLAAQFLKNRGADFVVIDDDFSEEDVANLKKDLLCVVGDATEDETLLRAGVDRAKGLIIAVSNPAISVFVALSAKAINPNIYIVARADEDSAIGKLEKAGADRVVNPYFIGGERMANLILHRAVVDFLETSFGIGDGSLRIESVKLPENCPFVGKSLKELDVRKKYGVSILAVLKRESPIANPGGDYVVENGDKFIVMGERPDLIKLEEAISKS